MKNEMNEIPTPETDAAEMCVKHTHRMLYDEDKVVDSDKMRDLERRLNVAREALQCALVDMSVNEGLTSTTRGVIRHVSIPTVKEALTQTAPKP